MNNQSTNLEKENMFSFFNINTDCMVSDIYETSDTPNGAIVYGVKLEDNEIVNHAANSRYGFVILLKDNNMLFRDIIDVTPTKIVIQDRKEPQQQILSRDQIESCYKVETREYY